MTKRQLLLPFILASTLTRGQGFAVGPAVHLRSLSSLKFVEMSVSGRGKSEVTLLFHGTGPWQATAKAVLREVKPLNPTVINGRLGPVISVGRRGREWLRISIHPGTDEVRSAEHLPIAPSGKYTNAIVVVYDSPTD